jgi:hypothetical protein
VVKSATRLEVPMAKQLSQRLETLSMLAWVD